MGGRRTIALRVKLDGRAVASETTYAWAGRYGLVITTMLPEEGLAAEVNSSFRGHAGLPTGAIHLTLGPDGEPPFSFTAQYERAEVHLRTNARHCVFEHVGIVLVLLQGRGYGVGIDVPDEAFDELERAES